MGLFLRSSSGLGFRICRVSGLLWYIYIYILVSQFIHIYIYKDLLVSQFIHIYIYRQRVQGLLYRVSGLGFGDAGAPGVNPKP